MEKIWLNCDLGENEPDELTAKLMPLVDAANIGCGVHAGSRAKMRSTLELARLHGVLVGAHPGLAAGGGRGSERPTPEALARLLEEQFGSFCEIAKSVGVDVSYLKLHGTLYHAVEESTALRTIYIDFLKTQTDLAACCSASGAVASEGRAAGITIYEEGFIDRAYQANGLLVSRSAQGAILSEKAAIGRFEHWQHTRQIESIDGPTITFSPQTWCVHGDSPEALGIIRTIRRLI